MQMSNTPAEEPAVATQTVQKDKPKTLKRKRRRRLIRRLIVTFIVLAILAGAGWIGYQRLRDEYRVTYDSYTATTGNISNSLSFSGTMQLINNKTYTASSSTKVRELYVAVGDLVKEGDKLVRLSDGTTVTADFDGKINKVSVAKGDEVNANDTLVQLADFDHMRVSIRIGESNITAVDVGQTCRVTVSSISATFDSAISSIDYASYTGNNVAYYTTTIDVDTSSVDNVYPGMQATVTIPQQEANNVVILKMDAISTMPNNSAFVYKQAADGSMETVPITVGVSNGNYVEIKEGVSDGEAVYVVAKKDESTSAITGLLSGLFGSQRVNAPTGMQNRNFGSGSGFGGGSGSGGFGGSGSSGMPSFGGSSGGSGSGGGSRNRSN